MTHGPPRTAGSLVRLVGQYNVCRLLFKILLRKFSNLLQRSSPWRYNGLGGSETVFFVLGGGCDSSICWQRHLGPHCDLLALSCEYQLVCSGKSGINPDER